MNDKVTMLQCPACGEYTLHPQRKTLGYHVCVNCSTVESVVGITTVEGTGDHTWNDIIIMDKKKALNIAHAEAAAMGRKLPDPVELLEMDRDEMEVSQSIKDKKPNVLDDENLNNTIVTQDADPNDDDVQGLIKGIDY
jgi:ABC-type metal ion transport system substrate-binding protein